MANPFDQFDAPPAAATNANPFDQFDAAPPPAKKQPGGMWQNLKAGLAEIPGEMVQMLGDPTGLLTNSPIPHTAISDIIPGVGEAVSARNAAVNRLAGKTQQAEVGLTGFDPAQVPETGFWDSAARNTGRNALAFMPGLGEAGLANKARSAVAGLGATLGQTAGQVAFPNNPGAQMATSLATGLVTGKLTQAPSAVRRAMSNPTDQQLGESYNYGLAKQQGITPEDLEAFEASQQGKPVIAAEGLGPTGLGAMRAFGTRVGKTGRALVGLLEERKEGTTDRIKDDFHEATGVDPDAALGDMRALVEKGQKAVKPHYEKAFDGSGTGIGAYRPALEEAFDSHARAVNDAHTAVQDAERQLMLVEGRATQASSSEPWQRFGVADERTAAERQVAVAKASLQQAETAKGALVAKMRNAQAEEEAGVKGGVWSPRLEEFMGDPEIKRGLAEGMKYERREARAEGRNINANDYAITGMDAEGNPIVSGVPNMRLLDVAKKGLDREIYAKENLDPRGRLIMNDNTRSLLRYKQAYLNELRNLNPDYGAALDKSADYLSAQSAFDNAQRMFGNSKISDKQLADFFAGHKDNETNLQAAKGGVANWMLEKAENGQLRGSTFDRPRLRKKLGVVIGDQAKADSFLQKMEIEDDMAKRGARMSPNVNSVTSNTESAAAEQDRMGAVIDAAHGIKNAYVGNIPGAARNAVSVANKLGAFRRNTGMPVEARDVAGAQMMGSPSEMARGVRAFQDSELAKKLQWPAFPRRGLVPALMPLVSPQQAPYRRGGFV